MAPFHRVNSDNYGFSTPPPPTRNSRVALLLRFIFTVVKINACFMHDGRYIASSNTCGYGFDGVRTSAS